ncbi:DotG/IcmE/VirB10 family protein [Roseovarius dicentrarchi]|uniref:DotG/IcmE/VirB10 family protein n=1 Tax=Roseovarius dicentrarchi TaxID=2250573 RepID=UPI000DEBAC5B|nr:DotG/IcmE/VirB10 family protein [Roseovarius dicentrarchi]
MSESKSPNENNDEANTGPASDRSDTADKTNAGRVTRGRRSGPLSFRNMALLTILAVGGAVGYEIWKNPELIGPSRVAGTPNLDDTPAGDQLRDSERYQDNLRRQNEDGAREAQESDTSFIATPDEPLRQIDDKPPATAPNPNRPLPPANAPVETEQPRTVVIERQQPARQQAQPSPDKPQPPDYARINQLAQLMATQQQGLIGAWRAQPSAVTIVVEEDLVSSEDAAFAQTSDGMKRQADPPAHSEPLIRAGEVVLASTIITNDSDTPGPVVAEIRKGPLKGARLLGGLKANQGNTHLIVRFNTAVLADGTQVSVSAYAVDARQKSLAVRSDLDRRLFARYAPRVAAAFVSGVGAALSDPGTSLIDLGGVTGVTRPAPTIEQGLYKGLAEIGNDLAGEFVQSAPKGPLISLRSRQIIGVLFTSNVVLPNR